MIKKRKGVSPIIATVLLIVLVVIIAAMIFLWAKRFVGEACEKQGVNAQLKCDEVSLEASRVADTLYLNNKGNVPIDTIRVKIDGGGSKSSNDIKAELSGGKSSSYSVSGMTGSEKVSVIPVLKGQAKTAVCQNVCENVEVEVLEQ